MTISPPTRVLVVLRSSIAKDLLAKALEGLPLEPEYITVASPEVLLQRIAVTEPALLILELVDNADLLASLRFTYKALPVVVVLAEPQAEMAFVASRLGAEELLAFSLSVEEMRSRLKIVLGRLHSELATVSPAAVASGAFPALFGNHPRMAEIRDMIAKVATTSATVLIRGESGVGKEVVARMIYARS